MTIAEDLLKRVPIGEENAVGSRLIWKRIGMWAASSVRSQLNHLTARGTYPEQYQTQRANQI